MPFGFKYLGHSRFLPYSPCVLVFWEKPQHLQQKLCWWGRGDSYSKPVMVSGQRPISHEQVDSLREPEEAASMGSAYSMPRWEQSCLPSGRGLGDLRFTLAPAP